MCCISRETYPITWIHQETSQFGFEGSHPSTLEETLNGGIGVVTYPFLSMIAGAEVEIL